jgi:hypothetical protein
LGYFVTIRYILSSFGTFFLVLVSRTMKNLATLLSSRHAIILYVVSMHIFPIHISMTYKLEVGRA